jgi:crotonobetainyl-CoA:carnitine CoA-transferase CaiB-like acyl-CoA transferase
MGADVIKVEPPGGDASRRMAGAVGNDSQSFNAVNRGKRGIVLDLKTRPSRPISRRLSTRRSLVTAKLGRRRAKAASTWLPRACPD